MEGGNGTSQSSFITQGPCFLLDCLSFWQPETICFWRDRMPYFLSFLVLVLMKNHKGGDEFVCSAAPHVSCLLQAVCSTCWPVSSPCVVSTISVYSSAALAVCPSVALLASHLCRINLCLAPWRPVSPFSHPDAHAKPGVTGRVKDFCGELVRHAGNSQLPAQITLDRVSTWELIATS